MLLRETRSHDVVARVREADIIARYGGEEFVILLPRTSREGALVMAERIRRAIEAVDVPTDASGPLGRITASFGVAECPRDSASKDQLVRRADEALFVAKRSGRNRVVSANQEPGEPPLPSAPEPASAALEKRLAVLERSLARQRAIRAETEALLEDKTRELFLANEKLVEQQAVLVQTEKMSALGRLSAGVAHEINNALNFLRGNSQHLSRYIGTYQELVAAYREILPTLAPEIAAKLVALEGARRLDYITKDLPKLLAAMTTGIERATTIVRDLGVFSRSDDQVEMRLADLTEPIEVALTLASSRLKHGVTVHKDYATPVEVKCDPGRISQVILNLLLNAADAVPEAGEIWIRVAPTGGGAIISVRDNGHGMARETIARIFEPFFTTKDPGKGTGLGLFISRRIVDEHGGTFQCESELGRGTTFSVTLPAGGRRVR